jgi:hypothetical protein
MISKEEARKAAVYKIASAGCDNEGVMEYYAGEGFNAGYDFAAREVAAAEGRIANLRSALEAYADKCDSCGHGAHADSCPIWVTLGWTRGGCGCTHRGTSLAAAALDADDG